VSTTTKPRPATLVVRPLGGRVSLLISRRPLIVGALIAIAMIAVAIAGLMIGDYPISVGQVISTLFGGGDQASSFIVETLRLPRVCCALLVGAALGVAGAIFQSITRNPLGSPDIIGFTYGSSAGAVLMIIVFGATQGAVAAGAVGAGLLTALVVYALAYRGGVQGYRLVLVGIGIGFMLQALTDYLLTRARLEDAQQAAIWIAGSLNGRGWDQAIPLAVGLVVLLPLCLWLARPMKLMELGDDAATALGVPVERTRLLTALAGVALTALATAAAGPISFVALAAPQIARRLTGNSGPGLLSAALMGAFLVQASDLAAQRLLAPKQLPVGVMTGAIGGLYLAWLLAHEWRSRRTG
jgi:iron complex transport system permease protein